MPERRFRHRAEYVTVRLVSAVSRLLPRWMALRFGGGIGVLFFSLDRRHRQHAIDNLAVGFPQWSPRQCAETARRVFVHFGRLLVELMRFDGLSQDDIRARTEIVGLERVQAAYRQGKGVLFFTGHFGFWEVHALAHGALIAPIAVVARPIDNPMVHALLERIRTSTGNVVIQRKGALRRILKALQSNQGVALLIDQHIQPADALVVDFFGRPAATTAALAALAVRTGAPVIPVFALPLPDGRFRLVYEPAVAPPADETPEALKQFTQRCTNVLEMYVRRYPDLWLWMHRRWRIEGGEA
ncbi:MAG: lysophospholipid acyltransferase family protein [Vicinamibacterales bacterium]